VISSPGLVLVVAGAVLIMRLRMSHSSSRAG
jgi:hypothetical protein